MKGILVAGFGGIGKTTLAKKYKNIIDLESSSYKYIIDHKLESLSTEERKGLSERKRNKEFPYNYYKEILKKLEDYDIVLISMSEEIIELLEMERIDYFVVYPKEYMINEILERCENRGNNKEFLDGVKDAWYRLHPQNSKNVIWMDKGEYLEEILIRNNLLKDEIIGGSKC